MKKPFVPFPVGTVRGPYSCGMGNDPAGGVQFLVQGKGGWVPFIGKAIVEENETRKRAEEYAKKVLMMAC